MLHRRQTRPRRRLVAARWRAWLPRYVLLLPMLVLFGMFTIYPLVLSWWYAFFDWSGIGRPTDWVGLDNFVEAFTHPAFWNAFRNSLAFSLVGVFIQLPFALALALVLNNERLRGRNIYRLMFFLPVVSTTAVVGIVLSVMLDPSGGPINEMLIGAGFVDESINFLGSEQTALPTVMAVDVWKGLGSSLIYWLAALQTVPKDVLEAARVDGAGRFQLLRFITVPMMLPVGIVIVILTFQGSLNPFDIVQVMTQGGPNYSTEVVSSYIYRYAFSAEMISRYGYASAVGVLFGVFTLILTLLQAPMLRRIRR